MDIHQIRCFVAVAEECHFARAAERLHMTASPVSRAVRDLERDLGVELLVRRYHQVELTQAGKEFLVRSRVLLSGFDDLKSVVRVAAHDAPRVIRIGGTYMAPPALFDRLTAIAEEVAAGRPVDIMMAPSSELLPDVESGEIDLVLVHMPVEETRLDSLVVAHYRFMVAMRSNDPLAEAPELALADLADRMLIRTPQAVHPVAMKRMQDDLVKGGLTKFRQVPGSDANLVASHVRRFGDLALALSPANGGSARVWDDPAFTLVPLRRNEIYFAVGLAWRRDRASSGVVADLVAAARRVWSDGPETV